MLKTIFAYGHHQISRLATGSVDIVQVLIGGADREITGKIKRGSGNIFHQGSGGNEGSRIPGGIPVFNGDGETPLVHAGRMCPASVATTCGNRGIAPQDDAHLSTVFAAIPFQLVGILIGDIDDQPRCNRKLRCRGILVHSAGNTRHVSGTVPMLNDKGDPLLLGQFIPTRLTAH